MRLFRVLRLRLRSIFRGGRVEQDLHDELRDHLERQIEMHVGAGMSREEARRAALRDFGNLPSIHEQVRDTRRVWWLNDVHHDIVYACRAIGRAPGFAAVGGAGARIDWSFRRGRTNACRG